MLLLYSEIGILMKNNEFNSQKFIFNVKLMVKYGWEPEIDIKCKDGQNYGLIAYSDGADVYFEDDDFVQMDFVRRIRDITELFDIIPAESILFAIDDLGLDYSKDLSDRITIVDGELWVEPKDC